METIYNQSSNKVQSSETMDRKTLFKLLMACFLCAGIVSVVVLTVIWFS
ncbi:MAG: hypothetical protein KDK33_05425 [Leptospiraceae bacterium]|nr:hypothetical protein [Leptospiraceae bacterium]